MRNQGTVFPLATEYRSREYAGIPVHKLMVRSTGKFRCPKAGEWFLSGAIIEGYRAEHDLSTPYHIAELVEVRQSTSYHVVGLVPVTSPEGGTS